MQKSTICPILSLSKYISEYMGTNNKLVLCQSEECEWWDSNNKCCIIHALSCLSR